MPCKLRNSPVAFLLLIIAAAALYLVGNARVALWDRDEPRYAMASRWMLRSGDWVVPRIGWGEHPEEPRTAKPPVIYWLQAGAMKLFGPGEFAARLPSAIGMVLTLLLVGWVLRKYRATENCGGKPAYFHAHAFWTVLILATSALCIAAAKMCLIDAVLLFFVTICQLCVFAMWEENYSWPVVIIFAIALGLAGLAKGPIVLGVILATIVLLCVLWAWDHWFANPAAMTGPTTAENAAREASRLLGWPVLKIFLAIAIVVAIVLPWMILVERRSPGFLQRIIGHDVMQRMSEPLEGHKGPPGFYLLTIFGTFFPWSIFLPMGIVNGWRHRREPAIRFAFAATIGPWLMLEFISTKMVHYLLPVFPPLAFLVADALLRCLRGESDELTRPASRWGFSIWAIITTAGATALLLPAKWFMQIPLWPGLVMMLAGLIYAIVVLSFIWHKKPRHALLSMGIGFWVLAMLLFAAYLPSADFLRISPNIADILNRHHVADARMIGYEEQSVAFYDRGLIDELPNRVLRGPVAQWPSWLVMSQKIYQHLPADKARQLTIVGKTRGIQYAKNPKPVEVLVVRKRP